MSVHTGKQAHRGANIQGKAHSDEGVLRGAYTLEEHTLREYRLKGALTQRSAHSGKHTLR